MKKILLVTVLSGFLIGCSHSPQKKYYYLSAIPMEQKTLQSSSANINTVIGVGPIDVADHLLRTQIISTQDNNLLSVSDNDYWAEPLDKGIARVISLNLLQRNANRSFVNFPWRSDSKPHYSLRIQINSLTRANNEASIIATWELIDNNTKANLQRRNFIRATPVDSGAKNLAQAYSKLLAELAGEMDEALRTTQD